MPYWLLPLRDALSVGELAASYMGVRVVWRGHAMRADDGRSGRPDPAATALNAAIPARPGR